MTKPSLYEQLHRHTAQDEEKLNLIKDAEGLLYSVWVELKLSPSGIFSTPLKQRIDYFFSEYIEGEDPNA